jgi:hypothetical protein
MWNMPSEDALVNLLGPEVGEKPLPGSPSLRESGTIMRYGAGGIPYSEQYAMGYLAVSECPQAAAQGQMVNVSGNVKSGSHAVWRPRKSRTPIAR